MIRLTITSALLSLTALFISISVSFCQSVRVEPQENFSELYKKASNALYNDLDRATFYATKALLKSPQDRIWRVNFLQALIYKKKKEYNQSVNFYKLAIENANTLMDSMYTSNNLANVYYEMGLHEESYKIAWKVVKYYEKIKYSRIYDTYGIIGKIYAKKDRLDSAKFFLNQAMINIPTAHDEDKQVTAGFLEAKANIYKDFDKYDIAIDTYKQAIKLQKTGYKKCEYLINLAECYAMQNDSVQAKKLLAKAAPLLGAHLHNQASHIRVTSFFSNQLDSLRSKINSLITANEQHLTKKDLKVYTDIRDKIQQKRQVITQTEKLRAERKASWRFHTIMVLVVLLATLGVIYWGKERANRLITQFEIISSNIRYLKRMRATHVNRVKLNDTEDIELNDFLNIIKSSPFRTSLE